METRDLRCIRSVLWLFPPFSANVALVLVYSSKVNVSLTGVFWFLNFNVWKEPNEWVERCKGWSEKRDIPPLPTLRWQTVGGLKGAMLPPLPPWDVMFR